MHLLPVYSVILIRMPIVKIKYVTLGACIVFNELSEINLILEVVHQCGLKGVSSENWGLGCYTCTSFKSSLQGDDMTDILI